MTAVLHFRDGHSEEFQVEKRHYLLHYRPPRPFNLSGMVEEHLDDKFLRSCGIASTMLYPLDLPRDLTFVLRDETPQGRLIYAQES